MARRPLVSRSIVVILAFILAFCGCASEPDDRAPLVLAAASLQESLGAAAGAWAAEGHRHPVISFAASSALARQIESGADAGIFVSADQDWMDSVEHAGDIRRGTRRDLVGNELVLIAPAGGPPAVNLDAASIDGVLGTRRLAMADPDSVPAGRYGKAALQSLGLWTRIERRIARGENVRAALALVERGEAPLGIVYATDARATDRVKVVASFPAESHPPIVYPVALLPAAGPEAEGFYHFLLSERGQAIFAAHGFTVLPR
jgi:molybdate transport system substrate-binding protein